MKVSLPCYNPFDTYIDRILFRAKLNTNRTLLCTHICYFIYAPKQSEVFNASIATKLTLTRYIFVNIFSIEFYPNQKRM